jgi:hypothetical protein
MNITIEGTEYEETKELYLIGEGLYYKNKWYLPKKKEKLLFPIGTKFKHKHDDEHVYIIDAVQNNKVYIDWKDNTSHKSIYAIKDANEYFKDGTWIEYKAPTPLLITEDGFEIFEGDSYYFIWIKQPDLNQKVYVPYFVEDAKLLEEEESWSKDAKYFSTQKAARNYIENNKPCLSFNDIVDNSHYVYSLEKGKFLTILEEDLRNLIKSKL